MIIESSCRFAVRPWPGLVLAARSVVRPQAARLPLAGWIPGPVVTAANLTVTAPAPRFNFRSSSSWWYRYRDQPGIHGTSGTVSSTTVTSTVADTINRDPALRRGVTGHCSLIEVGCWIVAGTRDHH